MMMEAAKVYIAGPMRGRPYFNFNAFYDAEVEVLSKLTGEGHKFGDDFDWNWSAGDLHKDGPGVVLDSKCGVAIFNPARYDHDTIGPKVNDSPTGDLADIEGVFDLRHALGRDLAWIAENATHIYMLKGWQDSKGAKAERALAQALGLTILYQDPGDPYEAVGYTTTLPTGEVRMTSLTGGEKGSKPARYDLIPAGPLRTLAELYGKGAEKYADRNWERGYDWSLSFAALNRHLWAFWQGEDTDPEHGLPHLASVAWHAFALMEWAKTHPEFDNRPKA